MSGIRFRRPGLGVASRIQPSAFFPLPLRMALVLLLWAQLGFGQGKLQQFMALSRPVRSWVLAHLRVARDAQDITRRALALTDSMRISPELDGDIDGGTLDAFRHGIWMALLVQKMPEKKAIRLGRAYERGNYLDFKHHRLEDGQMPDRAGQDMDLHNNALGCKIGAGLRPRASEQVLVAKVLDEIHLGHFRVIAKDSLGNSTDAQGIPIDPNERKGKWITRRCLVPSNDARR